MILENIGKQFRYRVIMGLGSIACLTITPMAVLRFLNGEWLIGWVDVGIIVAIIAGMVAVRRGLDPDRVGLASALLVSLGAGAITLLDLERGIMWIYAVIIANFMLARFRFALGLSLALTLTALLRPQDFADLISYLSFLFTALMATGFVAVHAWRSEQHDKQLGTMALQDPLTSIGNRRALLAEMEGLVAASTPSSLLLLDLDHFKRVNDTWGHERGDEVLRRFAILLQAEEGEADELFRLGGEEFVLLMPGAGLDAAAAMAERILQVLRERLLLDDAPVTASIGVSHWREGEDIGPWLARADKLMYEAKKQGRDRAVVEDPAMP